VLHRVYCAPLVWNSVVIQYYTDLCNISQYSTTVLPFVTVLMIKDGALSQQAQLQEFYYPACVDHSDH